MAQDYKNTHHEAANVAPLKSVDDLLAFLASESVVKSPSSFTDFQLEASKFRLGVVPSAKETTIVYFRYDRSLTLPEAVVLAIQQQMPGVKFIDQGRQRKHEDNPDYKIVTGFSNPHYDEKEVQVEVSRAVSQLVAAQALLVDAKTISAKAEAGSAKVEAKTAGRFGLFSRKKAAPVSEDKLESTAKKRM